MTLYKESDSMSSSSDSGAESEDEETIVIPFYQQHRCIAATIYQFQGSQGMMQNILQPICDLCQSALSWDLKVSKTNRIFSFALHEAFQPEVKGDQERQER